jgi:hypothetical protein
MELDALKELWANHDPQLNLDSKLRPRILRFVILAAFEALVGIYPLLVLGNFIYQNRAEPRYLIPAVTLHLWVIGTVAAAIRQVFMARAIDYAKPVTAVQKQIENLRIFRIRSVQIALLTGQLCWIPLLIVAMRGILGLDAYRVFGAAFIYSNLGVGVAIVPLAIWFSQKFPRFSRQIGGETLNRAAAFLDSLGKFREERPSS